ncbi:MAG TPA: GNAT family N-acetyltransferase [Candidatus Krumholzibacteria bacterium]|nr:GNAT family N-acetyltransferase [Candidatus Krumholzibacteria bacterium]
MSLSEYAIQRVTAPASAADIGALADLLVGTVRAGAAVSFLSTLTHEEAQTWWRTTLADPRVVVLVARDADGIAGTVQLQPAWAPNQPHRAEVVKLLVHERCRRRGVGKQLMHAIEAAARAAGFTLLTLDAKQGVAAEHLYRDLGWTALGAIPRYAFDPDGKTPHGAVFFYKELA